MRWFSQLNSYTPLPHSAAGNLPKCWLFAIFFQAQAVNLIVIEAFSQLNAYGASAVPRGRTKTLPTTSTLKFREFSQLNALNRLPTKISLWLHRPGGLWAVLPKHSRDFNFLKRQPYLCMRHEPRTTRGSVLLGQRIWRNLMS